MSIAKYKPLPKRTNKSLSWYREQLIAYVSPHCLDAIDAMAKDDHVSRSEFVSRLIETWVVRMNDEMVFHGGDRFIPADAAHELKRNLHWGTHRAGNRYQYKFPAREINDDDVA